MRILLVKTSSLGDVIHTLPAVTDAARELPGVRFDWVVEESFTEIPAWHPAVDRVIPCAIRRWRKSLRETWKSGEWKQFKEKIREREYDLAIDAQGLVKSAILVRVARCGKAGLDKESAREPLASRFYDRKVPVPWGQHAVDRVRQLFARALAYPVPETPVDYGVDFARLPRIDVHDPYVVFLHGTTWDTKHWPEEYWIQLAGIVGAAGYKVRLPWGNEEEEARANRIRTHAGAHVEVLSRLPLSGIAGILAHATAVVAVDTGLCHLAAAMNTPTVSVYGPTNPELTGAHGANQVHLAADFPCAPCMSRKCTWKGDVETDTLNGRSFEVQPPCFATLKPDRVWREVEMLLADTATPAAGAEGQD